MPAEHPCAHGRALAAAAERMGVRCERVTEDGRVLSLSRGENRFRVAEGRSFDAISVVQVALCEDKPTTKSLLAAAGVPVARDTLELTREAVEALLGEGPCVVKPRAGTEGEGVALDCRTYDEVMAAASGCESPFVETMAHGEDLRVHVLGGEVLAACVREPPTVVGDGVRTIEESIATHAAWIASFNEANALVLDEGLVAGQLAEQGWSRASVLPAGAVLQLNRLCNVAQGAIPVDATDRLHDRYRAWAARLHASLEFEVFALDFVTGGAHLDPGEEASETIALEINAQPDWLHHTVSKGRAHPVAERLIEYFLSRRRG